MSSNFPGAGKSGRGLPHSKSWRILQRIGLSRSVLECGSPLPLWISFRWKVLTAFIGVAAVWPSVVSACSVCYGEPDSAASRGLSWAITALAGIVVMVLAGAVAFFVQAARKADLVQAADSATSLIDKS